MRAEDAIRARCAEVEESAEPSDSLGSPQGRLFFALAGVMQSTLTLTLATAALNFAEGARARRALESARSSAELLIDELPEGPEHADALRRFQNLRGVAMRQLAIAPAPTLAAVAVADRGDGSLRVALGGGPQRHGAGVAPFVGRHVERAHESLARAAMTSDPRET